MRCTAKTRPTASASLVTSPTESTRSAWSTSHSDAGRFVACLVSVSSRRSLTRRQRSRLTSVARRRLVEARPTRQIPHQRYGQRRICLRRSPRRGASFMPEISTHQTEGTGIQHPGGPRPRRWEPRLEETFVPSCVLSVSERDRLVRLLALVPPPHRWAFEHRHTPLLCAIGILDPPDEDYARAARRRFADPCETRERALALLTELDREARAAPSADGRLARPRWWRSRVRVDPGGAGETPWVGRLPQAPAPGLTRRVQHDDG